MPQENTIQGFDPSNRSGGQSSKPLPHLTIQALDEDSHLDIFILYVEFVCVTVESSQVLFRSYVPFPGELGHVLQGV